MKNLLYDNDPTAAERKQDHIELAFDSQVDRRNLDPRFYYEPLLSGHPQSGSLPLTRFLGKDCKTPIWVSSMTGGTEKGKTINYNLARACKDFGMGMGLGSCRSLLYGNETFSDFNVRPIMGDEVLLFANLGVAQLEELIQSNKVYLVNDLVQKLQADGLIIHVNPLQEWLQPEGDRFGMKPIDVIETILEKTNMPIIVKEVGQGMGYASLRRLLQLPIAAIDFAANGGTNFAKLELLRSTPAKKAVYECLAAVGHSAENMVQMTNQLKEELGDKVRCQQIIISGGVRNFLDGYYLINTIDFPAVYGQASAFLKNACGSYDALYAYVEAQIQGLELAYAYLSIKK